MEDKMLKSNLERNGVNVTCFEATAIAKSSDSQKKGITLIILLLRNNNENICTDSHCFSNDYNYLSLKVQIFYF